MSESIVYYPLTHPQLGIWYTEKLYPGTSIGNIAATLKIKGNIDYNLLEKSINAFIEKNDGMRLRIVEENGEPKQYLSEYEYQKIDYFDFSDKDIKFLYTWDANQTKIPFDLIESALFYFAIFKTDDNEGGFYVKIHHCLSDAWTFVILGNKIMNYYCTLANKEEFNTNKAASYINFIQDEQDYINSARFYKDKKYWNDKFNNIPDVTTLKPKIIANPSIKAKRKTFILPQKLSLKIREYCNQNKTSPFILFLASLSIYCYRVLGKNDLVIGTPVLNRTNAVEKDAIGMFISTVPIIVEFQDDITFNAFIDLILKEWMGILRHQKYPYDMLLKDIRESNKGIEELYDIVLSYQNAKFNKEDNGLLHEGRWHFNGYQKQSLNIHINDREGSGSLIIDYDYLESIFYTKEIDFLHDHIIRILWHAIDNPQKLVSKIEMVSEKEKFQILNEFNDTDIDYPKDMTLHRIFEMQAEKTPDNIAVVIGDKQLSYRELNEKANNLAWELREKGIKPDDIIGIMFFRSFEMIISVLATWKAGGAYLPIDPGYPSDRINYMLNDSKSHILLTDESIDIKAEFNGEILFINSNEKAINKSKVEDVSNSRNLAYVIYTSGSTGKPKGVMIEHYSVVNRINWMQKKYPLGESDILVQKTPYTFDVSVWELVWWFFTGARLILLDPGEERKPQSIVKAISKYNITTIHFVPSMLNVFLDYIHGNKNIADIKTLKRVFSSGEALTQQQVEKFNGLLYTVNSTTLHNLYGPTEATIDVSYFDCSNEEKLKTIPIGKPIDNIKLYILDKHQNLMPIGAVGELYISGDGLARGYLNNEQLTDEKFVANPFLQDAKMYKTGDLARWFSKGDIEYFGRIDQQVKIRGYRIEMEEIQSLLLSHGSIKDAIVVCKENNQHVKYLCAYVVLSSAISVSELRYYLTMHLPSYMVPAYFVEVDSIPLSQNGKIDKKMLPEPSETIMASETYVAPRNEVETKILSIWKQILGIENIGVKDNFFNIGGDSLNAIRIASLLEWEVQVDDIYRYPTIELLSKEILRAENFNNSILIRLTEQAEQYGDTSVVCFPYGGGNSTNYKELSDSLIKINDKFKVYSVRLQDNRQDDDNNISIESTENMAQKIANEINMNIKGDIILYGHCVGSALTIETAKLLEKLCCRLIAVCIGGSMSPGITKYFGKSFDPWHFFSDKNIFNFLINAGLQNNNLDDSLMKQIMKAFRYDVKCFYSYFNQCYKYRKEKLNTKIYVIVGDKDPITSNYSRRYKNWCYFSKKVELFVIENAKHYFIKSHSDELADIISSLKEIGGKKIATEI